MTDARCFGPNETTATCAVNNITHGSSYTKIGSENQPLVYNTLTTKQARQKSTMMMKKALATLSLLSIFQLQLAQVRGMQYHTDALCAPPHDGRAFAFARH
jgi:hypothetical protein